MPTGTLPQEGKALFEKVYNKALSGSCKGNKECAARTAWSAVKGAGWHKDKEGDWVKGKSDAFAEFSMSVAKIGFDKDVQQRYVLLSASDTNPDLSEERMSMELFNDFIERIQNQTPIPEPFKDAICERGWCGGQPYVSISHYKSAGGKNVPGEIVKSFIDGNYFKSRAILYDTPLGKAVFKSLNDDEKGTSQFEDKVRVSIGFLDLVHAHGDFLFERKSLTDVCPKCAEGEGNKEYRRGILVHEAFTRKPMNPRTDVEVEKMAILTKKDDAASIIGEDILNEMDLETKSNVDELDDVIVIRSDGDMIEHVRSVMNGFYDAFSEPPEPVNPSPYVHSVMKDHVIASVDGKMYKIGYEMDGEMKPKFAKKGDWQEMKMGFMPVNKSETDAIIWMAATKSEGDCNHPSSHYLVVEDSEKPTTWHLRYRNCDGKVDTRLLGAAKAALTVGYRGNKYEGPNKQEALSKLKKLYKSAGLEWKSEMEDLMADNELVDETIVEEAKYPKDGEGDCPEGDEECMKKMHDKKMASQKKSEVVEPVAVAEPVVETAMDKAITALKSKIAEQKAKGIKGDAALAEIQPVFNELGMAVKSELTDPATEGLAETIRAIFAQEVAPVIAGLQAEISELKAKSSLAVARKADEAVTARSLTIKPVMPAQSPVQASSGMSKIAELARKSVFLQE